MSVGGSCSRPCGMRYPCKEGRIPLVEEGISLRRKNTSIENKGY